MSVPTAIGSHLPPPYSNSKGCWCLTYVGRERQYHPWYYDTKAWLAVTYLGVPCWKSVAGLWNYQEIIYALQPRLIVELGANRGGATLYFADVLSRIRPDGLVLTVDIDHNPVADAVRKRSDVELMTCSSTAPEVAERIRALRGDELDPVFIILDSDHSKRHVLDELVSLRPLTKSGDYLICEDSNINGHPVLEEFGPGPWEALIEYEQMHPGDYRRDIAREEKFGFTFAPRRFLMRT